MEVKGKTFTGETVVLDGNVYTDCTLVDCTLFFSGGVISLNNTKILGNTSITIGGNAALVLSGFQLLSQDPYLRQLITRMLDRTAVMLHNN